MKLPEVFRRIDPALIAAVAALLLLAGVYAWIVSVSEDYYLVQAPSGSVYSAADEGFQVLNRYLDELGVDTDTLEQFEELPDEGTLVVAAGEPFVKPFTVAEGRRLADWVDQGGRLLVVGHYAGEALEGTRVGAGQTGSADETTALEPLQPAVCFAGVEDVVVGPSRLLADGGEWVSLLKDADGQVLLSRTYGRGQIVWLADARPLSNAGLSELDNARFATLLTAAAGPVRFDEYHHGYASGGGAWERLGSGGRAAVSLMLLGALLFLASQARRIAPAIPQPDAQRARTGAYISSLAELFRASGAHDDSLATLAEGLRQALIRRYGSESVGRARHPQADEALDQIGTITGAGRVRRDRFVKATRAIARARREVEGRDG